METPILNFINATSSHESALTLISENPRVSYVSGGWASRPIGMWHQYGRLPSGSEGIYLEIGDVPDKPIIQRFPQAMLVGTGEPNHGLPENIIQTETGSLADLVGFAKESVRLGRTAPSKTIREAVVAVPFVEKENQRQFFTLPKNHIAAAIEAEEDSEVQGVRQSVKQMVDSMTRYMFPPSMDFINYPDQVTPFSMYIFEFEHLLNQQDLVDIWQNLPPRIGRAFDPAAPVDTKDIVQTKTVTHLLQADELLTSIDPKLQWMVFKVKQKAATNYWKKSVTNNPNLKLESSMASVMQVKASDIVAEGAGAGAIEKTSEFEKSYNWPYDYFSLVELVKIDGESTFVPNNIRAGAISPSDAVLALSNEFAFTAGTTTTTGIAGTISDEEPVTKKERARKKKPETIGGSGEVEAGKAKGATTQKNKGTEIGMESKVTKKPKGYTIN